MRPRCGFDPGAVHVEVRNGAHAAVRSVAQLDPTLGHALQNPSGARRSRCSSRRGVTSQPARRARRPAGARSRGPRPAARRGGRARAGSPRRRSRPGGTRRRHLLPAPRLVDQLARAGEHAPTGAPRPLVKSSQAVSKPPANSAALVARRHDRVHQPRAVEVRAQAVLAATSSTSPSGSSGHTRPPPMLVVCSTETTRERGR